MEPLKSAVTVPELARLLGLSAEGLYRRIKRGEGPLPRGRGKQIVVPYGSAVSWLEDLLQQAVHSNRRRILEEAIRELRVRWAFHRADQARHRQFSDRQNRPQRDVEEYADGFEAAQVNG